MSVIDTDFSFAAWSNISGEPEDMEVWRYQPITGPMHMKSVELHRKALGITERPQGWPYTDVFLMHRGLPSRRDLTQIGGLPYRRADQAWPVSPRGEPLRFLAQIRLAESFDILPAVPGDLLLVFCSKEFNVDDWRFEWQRLGIRGDELVQSLDQTKVCKDFGGCFGQRYRTFDCPAGLSLPGSRGIFPLSATKIGGTLVRDLDVRPFEENHILTISSVLPINGISFPWVNCPAPIPVRDLDIRRESLSFYDLSVANVFFRPDGLLFQEFDCP